MEHFNLKLLDADEEELFDKIRDLIQDSDMSLERSVTLLAIFICTTCIANGVSYPAFCSLKDSEKSIYKHLLENINVRASDIIKKRD